MEVAAPEETEGPNHLFEDGEYLVLKESKSLIRKKELFDAQIPYLHEFPDYIVMGTHQGREVGIRAIRA
jgi:hypothetical protein